VTVARMERLAVGSEWERPRFQPLSLGRPEFRPVCEAQGDGAAGCATGKTGLGFSSARRLSLGVVVGLNKDGLEHCQVFGPRELYTVGGLSGMAILTENRS
jgi:hypothetical protein